MKEKIKFHGTPTFVFIPVKGYEGYYWINILGEVKNRYGLSMRQHQDKNGYWRVGLTKKSIHISHLVHRLIAIHFISNPSNKPFINHINGITSDNSLKNLEWCTAKENVTHAFKTGLMSNGSGETHICSKFDDKTIGDILKSYRKMPTKDILKKFKISNSHFYNLLKLNNYSHAGRIFIRS